MITLYSKNSCVQCDSTKRFLKQKNIPYSEFNVEEDERAMDAAKAYGYLAAPVVVVDSDSGEMSGAHWSGFDPLMLNKLVAVRENL